MCCEKNTNVDDNNHCVQQRQKNFTVEWFFMLVYGVIEQPSYIKTMHRTATGHCLFEIAMKFSGNFEAFFVSEITFPKWIAII